MSSSYGIQQATTPSGEAERHAEEIRIAGFTLIKRAAPPEDIASARQELDRVYECQVHAAGGIERLHRINDADVVRCPLSANTLFLDLAVGPRILEIVRALLGDYFILQQQNGVINRPSNDHYQRAWHRDLPYQHFVTSRPLALSCLLFIDNFTEENGGTLVLPASHKLEPFPSEVYVTAHNVPITGNAGDGVIFDSMLFHCAGTNRSDGVRRGLNQVYALPFINQQICLPRALGPAFTSDPDLKRLLGYETEPADNAFEWRKRRLDKLS